MKSINEKIDEELGKITITKLPEVESQVESEPATADDIKILFSNDMPGCMDNNMSWTNLDTIQPLDWANLSPLLNTVNISGTGAGGTLGIGGLSGYQSSLYNTTSPTYSWNTLNNPGTVQITGAGIEMDADADITIGGRSMKKLLDGIEQRLSILVPDPKKLERYEALKQAYEHYKTLEALCNEEPKIEKS